jgi:hypothetical protein
MYGIRGQGYLRHGPPSCKGPAMALAQEDIRLTPRSDLSIVAEAASLDAPDLALSDSSSFRNEIADTDIISDSPTFLSAVDR